MDKLNMLCRAGLVSAVLTLACTLARQTPQPAPTVEQLVFEVQTSTPTIAPLAAFVELPSETPSPTVTPTSSITATAIATETVEPVAVETEEAPVVAEEVAPPTPVPPTQPPAPPPTVPLAAPLTGGEWDFEAGFREWANPFGDPCPGSGLATGWEAFTTRDEYGSSCMNQTTWHANVHTGGSAQEITFAYVGNQAGIFKSAPTIPGHRYTIEAFVRREPSPAPVEVNLGLDVTGGVDWQAGTVQWSPWDEDVQDQWTRAEETVTAAGESLTVFIKGFHPYPEPGGALRIDSITITDIGPE